ncbi:MAG: IniB N-terminal domain-containing protein [Pseudonocardiaceae bacterium]
MNDVLTVSSLIEFLLSLLRDEEAKAEFMADPHGTLARHGLDHLCAQDVYDVAPMIADHGSVHVKQAAQHSAPYHGDDPVRAISHITEKYEVTHVTVDESPEYNLTYVDDRDTVVQIDDRDKIVNVDDRDTTSIHADGDVTIENSFNEDNDVNMIEDSYNQDNDGVDNKGGKIDDSAVAGEDIEDSFTSDDDTTVTDSYKVDNSVSDVDASSDDTSVTTVQDSFTTDDDGTDVTVDDEDADGAEDQIAG